MQKDDDDKRLFIEKKYKTASKWKAEEGSKYTEKITGIGLHEAGVVTIVDYKT